MGSYILTFLRKDFFNESLVNHFQWVKPKVKHQVPFFQQKKKIQKKNVYDYSPHLSVELLANIIARIKTNRRVVLHIFNNRALASRGGWVKVAIISRRDAASAEARSTQMRVIIISDGVGENRSRRTRWTRRGIYNRVVVAHVVDPSAVRVGGAKQRLLQLVHHILVVVGLSRQVGARTRARRENVGGQVLTRSQMAGAGQCARRSVAFDRVGRVERRRLAWHHWWARLRQDGLRVFDLGDGRWTYVALDHTNYKANQLFISFHC